MHTKTGFDGAALSMDYKALSNESNPAVSKGKKSGIKASHFAAKAQF